MTDATGRRSPAVRPAGPADAGPAARLHAEQISEGFLSLLGPGFLRRALPADHPRRTDRSSSWPPTDGRVVGFVAGSADVGGLYRSFIRHDGLRAGLERRRPPAPELASGDRDAAPRRRATEPGAVAGPSCWPSPSTPTAQGTGVGGSLVDAFLDEVVRGGAGSAYVVVASENDGAIRLYQRAGFVDGGGVRAPCRRPVPPPAVGRNGPGAPRGDDAVTLPALAVVSFAIALVVTPVMILVARRTGIMDRPGALKSQTAPVPYLGGVGVFAGTAAGAAERPALGAHPPGRRPGPRRGRRPLRPLARRPPGRRGGGRHHGGRHRSRPLRRRGRRGAGGGRHRAADQRRQPHGRARHAGRGRVRRGRRGVRPAARRPGPTAGRGARRRTGRPSSSSTGPPPGSTWATAAPTCSAPPWPCS